MNFSEMISCSCFVRGEIISINVRFQSGSAGMSGSKTDIAYEQLYKCILQYIFRQMRIMSHRQDISENSVFILLIPTVDQIFIHRRSPPFCMINE